MPEISPKGKRESGKHLHKRKHRRRRYVPAAVSYIFARPKSELAVVVLRVEATLKADHQTAGLGVKAAKGGGGLDGQTGVGELSHHRVGQRLGLGLAEAVGDTSSCACIGFLITYKNYNGTLN